MSTALTVPQIVSLGDSQWISVKDAAALTGLSDFWLREQAKAGKITSRAAAERAANGKPKPEYLVSTLPVRPERAKLAVMPKQQNLPLLRTPQRAEDLFPRAEVPADQKKRVEEHYQSILPIMMFKAEPDRYAHLTLRDGRRVISRERMIVFQAELTGNNPRTLKRWITRFRLQGYAGLADRPRKDKGVSLWANRDEASAALANVVCYAVIVEHVSIALAFEIVDAAARRGRIHATSYETVRRLIRSAKKENPAAVTLSLGGRDMYDRFFAPFIQRGITDIDAGYILTSDHAIHDVIVQDDTYKKDRSLIRIRFTGLMDFRSRRFTAYAWSEEGSSRSIGVVLQNHLVDFGTFFQLYCDNGKDYQKAGRGARGGMWNAADLRPEMLGVVARIGAEVKFCLPFHPQAKAIERANNTIHSRFDRRWKTYCGDKPEHRPDLCIALEARHKKLLAAGRVEESEVPLASVFIKAARAFIESDYNKKVKLKARGMKGMSPIEAWDAYRWKDSQFVEPLTLAPLFLSRTRRAIIHERVHIGDNDYVAADLESAHQLHDRGTPGKLHLVLFDEYDDNYIAVADDDGYAIAWLRKERYLKQSDDEETRSAIKAIMEKRSEQYQRTKDKLRALKGAVLDAGYVPQHEQMLAIGNLPIPIDDVVVQRPRKAAAKSGEPVSTLLPGEGGKRLAGRLLRRQ
ncbi:MAG: helix-turn-helix domain-containing protein [Terracidiphilus sp.]|nr:helix-turn-helix domain-containing protein [Terracidiphilus sp.]